MNAEHKELLLQIARAAIFQGLAQPSDDPPLFREVPAELMVERATFVTLEVEGALRGCIGMLDACCPLAEDIEKNARAAAFQDPRFPPLSRDEFGRVEIHISILSPPEELSFVSENDLIEQIRPGIDGLILEDGVHRGTFLPSVWEQLPDKQLFLTHLKMKAGLSDSYWSDTLKVFRYTAEYFGE
jgi:AmmeMemoRadiSam system protein A